MIRIAIADPAVLKMAAGSTIDEKLTPNRRKNSPCSQASAGR
jgi:hypothetical protein